MSVLCTVEVLLSTDFRATCMGYRPDTTYEPAFVFGVLADTHESACEVAFAVCNSDPQELFCHPSYGQVVEDYRAEQRRSLSLGDVVRVRIGEGDWGTYSCETVGWTPRDPWAELRTHMEVRHGTDFDGTLAETIALHTKYHHTALALTMDWPQRHEADEFPLEPR